MSQEAIPKACWDVFKCCYADESNFISSSGGPLEKIQKTVRHEGSDRWSPLCLIQDLEQCLAHNGSSVSVGGRGRELSGRAGRTPLRCHLRKHCHKGILWLLNLSKQREIRRSGSVSLK